MKPLQYFARSGFSVSTSSCNGVTTATPTRILKNGEHSRCDLYGKTFRNSDEAFAAMYERGYGEPYYSRRSVTLPAFAELEHHLQQCKFDALYRLYRWKVRHGQNTLKLRNQLRRMAAKITIFHPVARVYCSPRHTGYDFDKKQPCGPIEKSLLGLKPGKEN